MSQQIQGQYRVRACDVFATTKTTCGAELCVYTTKWWMGSWTHVCLLAEAPSIVTAALQRLKGDAPLFCQKGTVKCTTTTAASYDVVLAAWLTVIKNNCHKKHTPVELPFHQHQMTLVSSTVPHRCWAWPWTSVVYWNHRYLIILYFSHKKYSMRQFFNNISKSSNNYWCY